MAAPQSVIVPAPHDGVGSALRAAFLPHANDMPRDIADLLSRIR